jgi:hypothetical protein
VLIAEVAVGILLTHRQNMLQALEISEDDETDAFLGKVQKIAFDADAIISGKKKLEETELNAFVSYHQGNCRMVACPLLGEEVIHANSGKSRAENTLRDQTHEEHRQEGEEAH